MGRWVMLTRRRLTCARMVELVTDYLEDALAHRDRARFERHVAGCDGCAAYLDQMRRTLHILGSIGAASIDPTAREALLVAFRDWHDD